MLAALTTQAILPGDGVGRVWRRAATGIRAQSSNEARRRAARLPPAWSPEIRLQGAPGEKNKRDLRSLPSLTDAVGAHCRELCSRGLMRVTKGREGVRDSFPRCWLTQQHSLRPPVSSSPCWPGRMRRMVAIPGIPWRLLSPIASKRACNGLAGRPRIQSVAVCTLRVPY